MAKLTEYPAATSFDSGDILIKDGTNGTKKISVDDASVNFIEIANQTVSPSQIVALDDYVLITNDTDGVRKMLVVDIGGNGGRGVNYSTTEQDTGLKWIDGKPIYQKTFVITNNNYVDISGLNIDTFVGINGLCSADNGDVIIPLYDNVTSEYRCYLDMDRANMRMRFNVYGWTLDSGHITLQYTKTTDQSNPSVIAVS